MIVSAGALVLGATLALYLVGAASLGANLFLRRPALLVTGRVVAVFGALFHFAAIGLRCAEVARAPFVTPAESLSLLAWMVVLAYLVVEALWRLSAAGPFALGLAFLLVGGAGLAPHQVGGVADPALLSESAVSLHIIATVASLAAFALAFCCAGLYLIVHHILKSKHGLAWMKRLPPLVTVEQAGFALVALGFPLLTLGILSGIVRALSGGLGAGWPLDTKTLLAVAVWGIYGLYLLARLRAWPPVRTAYVLLVGLALCLLLFFVPSAAHRFVS